MYCLLYSHACLCGILHLMSTVSCQMSTFYGGSASRNISCQFNVLNMHLQYYIYYWSLEIFKGTAYSYYLFGFETYRLISR